VLLVAAVLGIVRHYTGATHGPLRAAERAGDIGIFGLPVRPGEVADLTAPVTNTSRRPVILDRATLITVAGQPAPHFSGARLATTLNMIGDRGWPPPEPSVALSGATIPPGATAYVYFGVVGTTPGRNYGAAGITLSYRQGSHHYRVRAWGPGVACVRPRLGDDTSCDKARSLVRDVTEKLAARD